MAIDSGLPARGTVDRTADWTSLKSLMKREGKQRVAMNEATFRKVNEGMEIGQDPSGLLTFLCECGRLGCNKLIQLTRAEYEGIRQNPRRFAILDGHEIPEAEAIVERHDRYVVVEKAGDPEAEIVEHTDPRRTLD
jgi:hypothetical protein